MAVVPKHQMRFKVVTMTPTWASELLKKNHKNNRRVKDRRVNSYGREMAQGLWRLTHQAVAVDEDGWLVDGQHRLEAVVASGCDVPVVLALGVPRQSMVAVDSGANRNLADATRVHGNPLPALGWGSVARTMMVGMDRGRASQHIGHQEIMAFIRVHYKALDFAFSNLSRNYRNLTPAPVRAVIARAYYQRGQRTRIGEFCEALKSGLVNDKQQDVAVLRLRNWLLNLSESRGKRTRFETYAKTEWALRQFIDGQDVAAILATKEELFEIPQEAQLELCTE